MFKHRADKPAAVPIPSAKNGGGDPYAGARADMIEHQLRRRGVVMHAVLEAMREVPRHLFVSHEFAGRAYADEALPSVAGQTISQPFMVGIMTQELSVHPGQRVLEIGTGTGYQTAILAFLVGPTGEVCTIEREEALAKFARHRLEAMEVKNVRFLVGDGTQGWPADAGDGGKVPRFDRILVTAGTPQVPGPLLEQLTDGGILVAPVGSAESQVLTRVERKGEEFRETKLLGCRFVPLVGKWGWGAGEGGVGGGKLGLRRWQRRGGGPGRFWNRAGCRDSGAPSRTLSKDGWTAGNEAGRFKTEDGITPVVLDTHPVAPRLLSRFNSPSPEASCIPT